MEGHYWQAPGKNTSELLPNLHFYIAFLNIDLVVVEADISFLRNYLSQNFLIIDGEIKSEKFYGLQRRPSTLGSMPNPVPMPKRRTPTSMFLNSAYSLLSL